jgi:hypothetical protein
VTQGQKHVRWVVGCVLGGFAIGAATLWPSIDTIVAAFILLIPGMFGAIGGLVTAAGTLGDREDWYIRSWGFLGFIVVFQACALAAVVVLNSMDS